MTRSCRYLSACLALASFTVAHEAAAQDPARVPVFVEHVGSDEGGRLFAYGLREALRTSAGYSLAESRESSRLQVVLVSVADRLGRSSAISVSLVAAGDQFITAAVRLAGISVVEQMGRDLLALVDAEISTSRARLDEFLRYLDDVERGLPEP